MSLILLTILEIVHKEKKKNTLQGFECCLSGTSKACDL